MLLTQSALDDFFNQLDFRFYKGYQEAPQKWSEIAEQVPSSTELNTYSWLAALPGLRKWVGPRLVRNLASRAYQLRNDDFEETLKVDRNKLADDQDGIYSRDAEMLGRAVARWKEDLIFDLITANPLAFDNQNFFDTDHPVDLDDTSKGVYSNSRTTKPLSIVNYNELYGDMMGFKDESGKPMNIEPDILLVSNYGPDIQTAMQIASGEVIPQTFGANTAAAGVTNVLPGKGRIKVVISARIAAQSWYLMHTQMFKPFIVQVRQEPVTTRVTDPQHPVVFNEKAYLYGVEARGAAGVTLPFLAIKATA